MKFRIQFQNTYSIQSLHSFIRIKLGWKCYLIKSCLILFKLWYFLDKVLVKNMIQFQLNWTTFYKIKFSTESGSSNDYDTFFKKLWSKKSIIIFINHFWCKILFSKKLSDLIETLKYFFRYLIQKNLKVWTKLEKIL